ncbi:hypothetical protein HY085_03650 [Candidatus Gottesmanbacteria bacterium]|nr:hypothetical protein [Candidatus Gottesmanbacteria bacterium]
MFSIFLRRIQRFIWPLKIFGLAGSLAILIYLIIKTPPELINILTFSLVLFIFLSLLFNSLLISLAISFLLFLKAVSLFSLLNILLFMIFLILLGLYLQKK